MGNPENQFNDVEQLALIARQATLNAQPGSREYWEAAYGKVWTTAELSEDFEVIGFQAPFCVVKRRSDGQKGSLEFAHNPRFYFNFLAYDGG